MSRRREDTYLKLQHWLRDIHGQAGHGAPATSRAYAAAAHTTRLSAQDNLDPSLIRDLARIFGRLDDRIGRVLELGARENLFLQRVLIPEIASRAPGLVKVQAARFEPLDSSRRAGLVAFVRNELRRTNAVRKQAKGDEPSLRLLEAALRASQAINEDHVGL